MDTAWNKRDFVQRKGERREKHLLYSLPLASA